MKQITLKVFHLWQGYSRALLRWMYAGTYRMRTTENLDTVLTFDLDRFRSGWLPAIDMLRSRSNLLTDHRVGAIHRETAADMLRIYTTMSNGLVQTICSGLMTERKMKKTLSVPGACIGS